jgi:hypothetical protein
LKFRCAGFDSPKKIIRPIKMCAKSSENASAMAY